MRLLGGHDQEIAEWAGRVLDKRFVQPVAAFGILNDQNELCGAAIFNDFYPGGNIEMTYLGAGTITRKVIRELALYVFKVNQCSRLTIKTAHTNKLVQNLAKRLGFRYHSTHDRYFGPRTHAVVFTMSKEQARKWM